MGRPRLSHNGQVDGYQALLALYPEELSAVIILANWLSPEADLHSLRVLLERHVLGRHDDRSWIPPVVAPDKSRWSAYEGAYLSDQEGLLQVRATPAGLTATWNGERMLLDALAPDHYVADRKYGLGFPNDPDIAVFKTTT